MAPIDPILLQQHHAALDRIDELLAQGRPVTNWTVPDEIAHFTYELARMAPENAIRAAKKFTEKIDKDNQKAAGEFTKAVELKNSLKKKPLTDLGNLTLFGFIQRQVLSLVNGTPLNGLDRFLIDDKGLQIYRPFAIVSQRTIKPADIKDGKIVLSVNPPGYFDAILGILKQINASKRVQSPWGQLVLYEPSSGKNIGAAVALWPDDKKKQFEDALKAITRADNRYEGYKRLPTSVDLFLEYDRDLWALDLQGVATMTEVPENIATKYAIPPEKEEKKEEKKEVWKHWPKVNGCLLALILATAALLWIPLRILLTPFRGIINFFFSPIRRILGIFLPG